MTNSKFHDLTGQVFGRLTVVRRIANVNRTDARPYGQVAFECECSCGVVVPAVYSANLKSGGTRSCGCLQRDYSRTNGRLTHGLTVGQNQPGYSQRAYNLWYSYRITLQQYDNMLASQGGHCATCVATKGSDRDSDLFVDHDHQCCPGSRSCGHCIRGLLCRTCNTAEGLLDGNQERIFSLSVYGLRSTNVLGAIE